MLALALLLLGGGGFTLYAGMSGQKITPALRDVLGGKKPEQPFGGSGGGGAWDAPSGTGAGVGAAAGTAAGGALGGLTGSIQSRLQALMAAAPGSVTVTSGLRSNARQAQLWAEALRKYGDPEIADNWVARPGTSNHERGLAADLRFSSNEVQRWAHANAARFGLVFPLSNEPWHIELARGAVPTSNRAQPVVLPWRTGLTG